MNDSIDRQRGLQADDLHHPDGLLDAAGAGLPASQWSCFGDQPFLLLRSDVELRAAQTRELAAWLEQLACPSIAIGPGNALSRAADVQLACIDDAQSLVDNIRRKPVAAAVFVRLLRVTAAMPVAAALEVESLAYATLQAGAEYAQWLAEHRAAQPASPDDSGPAVLLERDAGQLRLQLNRASNRNAMNVEMRDALVEALGLAIADASVESLHISARGRCFSTGGDLTEFGTVPDPALGHLVRALSVPGRSLLACADRAHVQVHGACIGSGIEFPAFAARLTAGEDAFFQLPEIGMGLIPGAGGCISIARRIGRQRLAAWALGGQRIDAHTALDWGLVDALENTTH